MHVSCRYKNFPKAIQGRIIYVIRSPKGAALELYNSGTYDPTKGNVLNFSNTYFYSWGVIKISNPQNNQIML